MSQPRVKWFQVKRYFLRRGYEIRPSGGDKIIVAPQNKKGQRSRNMVRIGHKCCSQPAAELYDCYLSLIKRTFGVTRAEIIKG